MHRSELLLLLLPGVAWSYVTPIHLSRLTIGQSAEHLPDGGSSSSTRFPGRTYNNGRRNGQPTHAGRCRPLFKKFSKGGPGKQAELMELMAKAQRDSARKEMEERLRDSGDLPPEDESKTARPNRGSIKAERSWREGTAAATSARTDATSAGAAKSPTKPVAPASKQASGAAKTSKARKVVHPVKPASRVSKSTSMEGRPNDVYADYDDLLDSKGGNEGTRFSPTLEDPGAAYLEIDKLKEAANWKAAVAGKPSLINRDPLASEGEYNDFEDMLTYGTRPESQGRSELVAPEVLDKRIQDEIKKAPTTFSAGEFAPLDPWRALSDTEGTKVNFGLYRGTKPLLVVADPIPGSTELREAMQELNTRMPRKLVDILAVTADSPGSNRKAVKKGRIAFPVLSDDEEGSWMLAYRLKSPTRKFEETAFLIEPDLGTILSVWSEFDPVSLVDLVKEYLKNSA